MKTKLILLLSGILFLSCQSDRKEQRKPNVLFIIADDLTATAVSAYGNKISQTPNIDGLAVEGVRYTRAYCQYPVCGPSRASFLTGYYPNATQTFGYVSGRENIGNERFTWPQLFKNNFFSEHIDLTFWKSGIFLTGDEIFPDEIFPWQSLHLTHFRLTTLTIFGAAVNIL